jgi:hypothetical protein
MGCLQLLEEREKNSLARLGPAVRSPQYFYIVKNDWLSNDLAKINITMPSSSPYYISKGYSRPLSLILNKTKTQERALSPGCCHKRVSQWGNLGCPSIVQKPGEIA